MTPSNKLLSDLVTVRTYSKYLPELQRREIFEETINRCMTMHLDRFPKLSKEIVKAFSLVHQFKVMPSMRSMQFSGSAILKNNLRSYNCAFSPINEIRTFSEIFFLLLSGAGVGFSVQKTHINQLPRITKPTQEGRFIIQDSIAGWAQALHMLMEAYFTGSVRPVFDFTSISPKGTLLNTTGAKAPGPSALKGMLELVESKLVSALGRKLEPIEVHDLVCIVSDAVLAGGIRRSSLISFFDRDNKAMLLAKSGKWWENNPYRARANNSAVLPRHEITKEEFLNIFKILQESNSGEPGFSFTNNTNMLANPCHEVALCPNQLCNLSTVNQTGVSSKKDFLSRVYSAAFIGTLQASYTDFPYVSDKWRIQTEKEALLGVSFTGIADANGLIVDDWISEAGQLVLDVNEKYAKKMGINLAARTTVIKPEGSASCTLGSSSGIHARKSPFYLRRVQINKDDALYLYLLSAVPDLMDDAFGVPNTAVVTIPQESPAGALTEETETSIELFNRVLRYNKNWISSGHRSGDNKNNVSCTLSVKPEEWDKLGNLMWKERDNYTGISLFPFDNGTYQQAPFQAITKEEFEEWNKKVKELDLTKVKEFENNTNLVDSLACGGGACDIMYLK